MKIKILLLSVVIFIIYGCEQPSYVEGDSYNTGGYEIKYFKDTRTNLCFAERGMMDGYSFTCVPCDSIKALLK
jgi:hypothetical protein